MDSSIDFQNVTFYYHQNGNEPRLALNDVNLKIYPHSFTAIVGKTGSGKSTLIQHINGLLKPVSGSIKIGKTIINNKTSDKKLFKLRKKVGIVFQSPERQLFEDSVLKDVAFGPKNMGYNDKEAIKMAKSSLHSVHFPYDLIYQSPFNLSGGQMRKAAIAGILVMKPKILILDEPTAGLDQIGKNNIMKSINHLYHKKNLTIIMVTHQMNDVANYANSVVLMHDGRVVTHTSPRNLFKNYQLILNNDLDVPEAVNFAYKLRKKGIDLLKIPLNVKELSTLISYKLKNKH